MKYFLILLLAFLAVSPVLAKKEPAEKTWSGYLMDKMCAKRKAGDIEKMTAHTKTCLIEESCSSSGYGVVVGKKFIPFDAKGNEIAASYLKSTSKEKDFKVEVTGRVKNNKIAVTAIK
jgi:hypothetical protein